MKKMIFLLLMYYSSSFAFGQLVRGPIDYPAPGILNGVYVPSTIPTKKVIPYTNIREADVTWSKRVWSVIDLREKFNQPLYYPREDIQNNIWNVNPRTWSMWTILRYHILNGEITLYSPFNPDWEDWKDGDSFRYPIVSKLNDGNFYNDSLLKEEMFIYFGEEIEDPNPVAFKSEVDPSVDSTREMPDGSWETVYPDNDTLWYLSQDIVQYKVKEDWFFDKERSVMDRRIIGIAPVIYQRDNSGNITGLRELFWVYFPECRYVFQNFFINGRNNDAQRMSLDDLFWKRMFHSYIVKESNIHDREIDSYKMGVDALLESDQIKEQIFSFEHDLWEF